MHSVAIFILTDPLKIYFQKAASCPVRAFGLPSFCRLFRLFEQHTTAAPKKQNCPKGSV